MLDDHSGTGGDGTGDRPQRTRSKPFTDRYLAALKPRAARYAVLDPRRRGLLVRVSPKGAKTFYFRYKRGGCAVLVMIGLYPAISLQEAYEAHAELVKRLNRGENLRTIQNAGFRNRGTALPAAEADLTVGELADEFLNRYLYRERKNPREAELILQANIVRHWRTRSAKGITRRDGILLLDKVVDRGSPVMANRIGALMAQMFRFGVERGMLDASPFVAMTRPGGSERSRRRRLNEAEIRIFWKKLTRSTLSPEVRSALKLILATAQRPGEVALAAWSEFDIKNRVWAIPAERSKNGQPHVVPLSDLALNLIRHLRRRFGETPYLIPSRCWRARHSGPITVRSLSQGIRDRRAHFGIPGFTPHDLRRSAASLMTASGTPRLHVEKVLNHTIDDVAEIYDRHDYFDEKRIAIECLGDRIMNILRQRGAAPGQARSALQL